MDTIPSHPTKKKSPKPLKNQNCHPEVQPHLVEEVASLTSTFLCIKIVTLNCARK